MTIKVITAPGPVCFPLLASGSDRFEISFAKEGDAPIILDSSVSLIKRNVPIDMVLLSGLSVVYPDLGQKMALWRRGSANDHIAQAIIRRENLKTELVYVDNPQEISSLIEQGKVDSAILPVTSGRNGIKLEERAARSGLYVPGSCSAKVPEEYVDLFREAYLQGIDNFRKEPEKTADLVNSKLPSKFNREFVYGSILKMKPVMKEPGDYSELRKELLNGTD